MVEDRAPASQEDIDRAGTQGRVSLVALVVVEVEDVERVKVDDHCPPMRS